MWRVSAVDRQGVEVAARELESGELTIGRDSDRSIILPSPSVSRRHARLYVEAGRLYAADEGSSNGVVINGIRIGGPTAILDGMRIEVAEFRLIVDRVLSTEAVPPLHRPEVTGTRADRTRLLAEGGPFDGRFFEVAFGENFLGRALENQLAFDDPSLSRRHARIMLDASGRVEVEDLQSSNGTYVNGRRVGKGMAGEGDAIRFGELQFRIVGPGASGTRATRLPEARAQWVAIVVGGVMTLTTFTIMLLMTLRHPSDAKMTAAQAIGEMRVKADDHVRVARGLYGEKKYVEALAEVERGFELDPANAEARRLRVLAKNGPEDERSLKAAVAAMSTGVRRGFESALHLREEISPESQPYAQLTTRLRAQLEQFGLERCQERGWADCGWALCRAQELGTDETTNAKVQAALKDVERHMPRARCLR